MGTQDDVEALLKLFERVAVVGEWTGMERALRLLPLLSGEAQLAAQQLPADRMLEYDDLKRAILQRVGRTPEQHRQRLRALTLREVGRPFAFTHQLRNACRRWLRDEDRSTDEVLDRVMLEQFITRLPPRTEEWVQCQRPETVEKAVQLAEDHLAASAGAGGSPGSPSESPSSLSPGSSLSPPIPLPWKRGPISPKPVARPRAPPSSFSSSSPSALAHRSLPLTQQVGETVRAGAERKPGPVCSVSRHRVGGDGPDS
ncbi:zinc finger protein 213-like [Silurus meridionalis]|uniref:zinc finger protein 213-like n=1 Tax=Silurus meridionalis TaxID=175797 RepID=UPI001EE9ECEE|nr:zinc finger protein 213-like [Silurus meridionalis]